MIIHYCDFCYQRNGPHDSLGRINYAKCDSCNRTLGCTTVMEDTVRKIELPTEFRKESDVEILKTAFSKIGILFRELDNPLSFEVDKIKYTRSICIDSGYCWEEGEAEFFFNEDGKFLAHALWVTRNKTLGENNVQAKNVQK